MITPDLTLIHLSDTHLLPNEADRMMGVDTMATLRQVIELIGSHGLRPDGFVVTGDLAQVQMGMPDPAGGGPSKHAGIVTSAHADPTSGDVTSVGAIAAYTRLRTVVREIEQRFAAPVVLALGNHDRREDFRAGYLGIEPTAAPYDHSERIGDLRVIALDSSIPGLPFGELDAAQLEWLRAELRTPAPGGTILAFHHPPVAGPIPVLNAIGLRNPDDLAAAIRGSDVIGILAGHVHHATWSALEGIPCSAAGATFSTLDPLSPGHAIRSVEGAGFSLVQFYGRTMVSTAVSLPSMQRELSTFALTEDELGRLASGGARAAAQPVGAAS